MIRCHCIRSIWLLSLLDFCSSFSEYSGSWSAHYLKKAKIKKSFLEKRKNQKKKKKNPWIIKFLWPTEETTVSHILINELFHYKNIAREDNIECVMPMPKSDVIVNRHQNHQFLHFLCGWLMIWMWILLVSFLENRNLIHSFFGTVVLITIDLGRQRECLSHKY